MKYPFIIQKSKRNYTAVAAQFGILVTATNKPELEQKFEMKLDGYKISKSIRHHDIDTSDFVEEWFEIVDVEPTTTNSRSLETASLIKKAV